MITSLKLETFRIFTDLEVKPLQRINLFAGSNNTGKTGLLEALCLLFGDFDQISALPSTFRKNLATSPNQFVSDDYVTFWQALFHDKEIQTPAGIYADDGVKKISNWVSSASDSRVQIGYTKFDSTPAILVNSSGPPQMIGPNPFAKRLIVLSAWPESPPKDAELYNQVALTEGGEDKLLQLLREIDPRLTRLRYAKPPGTNQPLVYASFGMKNAISISQAGQGFSKLFSLFCQLLVSKGEILLIDEIENGLYYETLPQIWRGIATLAASENIQVFATTHSEECIFAAHEAMKEQPSYDFALHRLQRVKGKLEAVTHDRGMLEAAFKTGLEVR